MVLAARLVRQRCLGSTHAAPVARFGASRVALKQAAGVRARALGAAATTAATKQEERKPAKELSVSEKLRVAQELADKQDELSGLFQPGKPMPKVGRTNTSQRFVAPKRARAAGRQE